MSHANKVAGQVIGSVAKSLGGGAVANSIGKAIVRGALGGILKR